jgi:hypothetical protein
MANGAGRVVVAVLMGLAAIAARAEADDRPYPTVVLHVSDLVSVPAKTLRKAQASVARIYDRIGVALEWTDGSAAMAPDDGALHLDVIFLTDDMEGAQLTAAHHFGKASHLTRRAYIFFGRILGHARETFSDPAQVLTMVLGHEIGHMLLPDGRHSRNGLMRGSWSGRILEVPGLTPGQGSSIRSLLAAAQ